MSSAYKRYRGYKYPGQPLPGLTIGLNALAFPALFYCEQTRGNTAAEANAKPPTSAGNWSTSTRWECSARAPARRSRRWSDRCGGDVRDDEMEEHR